MKKLYRQEKFVGLYSGIAMHRFFMVLLSLTLISCASVTTQPDWDFIQSLGGIDIEPFNLDEGIYYLPIKMSVASYKKNTKSEMVCLSSSARVSGKKILIRIRTDSKKNYPQGSAQCPDAKVGGIPDGNYRVVHIGPKGEIHKVGDVVANLSGY